MKIGRPIVALIEDDPLVRAPLARAIDARYNVLCAANGVEALTLLREVDKAIDVAIIDVVLPGRLDGIAVALEAKRVNPKLRVVFTSGHPPPAGVDLSPVGEFLPKPARVATLLSAIARQLEAQETE